MRRAHARLLLWVLTLPWLVHCATLPRPEGEMLFRAGNLVRAGEYYERSLVNALNAREVELALFRLITIYAAPGPTFDPVRSQVFLDRLLREFPRSTYRTEAEISGALTAQLLALEASVEQARTEVAALGAQSNGCRQTVRELGDDRQILLQMGTEEAASRRACENRLASLRKQIKARGLEIVRLNEAVAALERLRSIDTERDPGGR